MLTLNVEPSRIDADHRFTWLITRAWKMRNGNAGNGFPALRRLMQPVVVG